MAVVQNILQSSETNLVGYMTTAVLTTDTTLYASFRDKVTGLTRTPASTTKMFIIDKGSPSQPNPQYEIILCASHSTTNGITTLTGCTRGLAYSGTSLASVTANVRTHTANAEIGCVDVHFLSSLCVATLQGNGDIVIFPTFADATARDAAIPTPTNGMVCYLASEDKSTQCLGGGWVDIGTGATFIPATTLVAGKVQLATQNQNDIGTATGSTGSSLVATPAIQAVTNQNGTQIYGASSGGTDTYAITLAPVPSAYVVGQTFRFKADVANTGACTLNVNSLGAKTIKKNHDQDTEDGDIEAGSMVTVIYDGTNFQMQTPIAMQMSSANITDLTDGGSTTLHTHNTIKAVASDNLKQSADTERTNANFSYEKKKEILIDNIQAGVSTIRVKFDMKSDTGGSVKGRIYKNGVAYGTEQTTTSTTYVTYSEDLTFVNGDLIQLYCEIGSSSGQTCYVKNFRLYYDLTLTTDTVVITN